MSIQDTGEQDRLLHKRRGPWLRRLSLALVALSSLALLFAFAQARTIAGASISRSRLRVATVERGELTREVSARGTIVTGNSRGLYAFATGIVELRVIAGAAVKKGEVLATIDSPNLSSRLVQERALRSKLEAQASRSKLDTQMSESQATTARERALIELRAAQRELESYSNAAHSGAFAQRDIARAKDELERAKVALATATRELSIYAKRKRVERSSQKAQIEQQQAVVRELERQLDALVIRAPFDGQVGQLPVSPGSRVEAGTLVLRLVDLSDFEVELKVPESYAKELQSEMLAQIRYQDQDYQAVVASVSPEVVDQQVVTRLRFVGSQPKNLRRNQRVQASIEIDTRKNVLHIERGPFVDALQGQMAWVMYQETAKLQPVKLGARSMQSIEVLQGLQEGDQVVIAGTELFGEHKEIRLIP